MSEDEERNRIIALALGRIFRLGSRPTQPGDVAEYERCRCLILDLLEVPPGGQPEPVASILQRHRARYGDSA